MTTNVEAGTACPSVRRSVGNRDDDVVRLRSLLSLTRLKSRCWFSSCLQALGKNTLCSSFRLPCSPGCRAEVPASLLPASWRTPASSGCPRGWPVALFSFNTNNGEFLGHGVSFFSNPFCREEPYSLTRESTFF